MIVVRKALNKKAPRIIQKPFEKIRVKSRV